MDFTPMGLACSVYGRTTTLKLGAVVGEHSDAKSTTQNGRERHVDTTVVGRDPHSCLWVLEALRGQPFQRRFLNG